LAWRRPSHQLIATVNEATQGNPLFILEVFHHLVQHEALEERGGYLITSAAPADLPLPTQVTSAIVGRVQRLGEDCRSLLTLAAFLGDRFGLEVLGAVSGMDENALLNLLEEGIRQHLLRSDGQSFQFAHPLIRHVFYREPSALRRQRLHHQISATLERAHAATIEAHVLEIAHHVVRAFPAADAETVVKYAHLAGNQALSVFAWGEAARYYEAALAAAEKAGLLSVRERADLSYLAALARLWDGDIGPCRDHYETAIASYRQIGDLPGLARALMLQARSYNTAVSYGILGDLQPLEETLAMLGESEPELRCSVLIGMSEVYWVARQSNKAAEMAQRALEIGRGLKHDHLCALASFELGISRNQELHVEEALQHYRQARTYAQRVNDRWFDGWLLHRIPTALILLGRFDEAEATAHEAYESALHTNNWRHYSLTLGAMACVALARGNFQGVERHGEEALGIVSRWRFPFGGAMALQATACAHALRGSYAEAESALDKLVEPGCVFENPGRTYKAIAAVYRQLVRAYRGTTEAPPPTRTATVQNLVMQEGFDATLLPAYCALVELAALDRAPTVAEPLYEVLRSVTERGVTFSRGWVFLLPRVLGVAAAVNRWWERAEGHFRSAIALASAAQAQPELGRTYLDYAHMLLARRRKGDRARAIECASHAQLIFEKLDMGPFAHDASQLVANLQSHNPRAAQRRTSSVAHLSQRQATDRAREVRPVDEHSMGEGTVQKLHIILVAEVEGSMALLQRLGDAKSHELLGIHNALIRACLHQHNGMEVTHTGDGIEASFQSASSAVACAIAIQQAFAQQNTAHPDHPIRLRIGLNAGEPLPVEGGLFGAAVHTAFRICSRAKPEQILAAEVIHELAVGKGFVFSARGRVRLKGLPGRVRLYEVHWQGDRP
jgi:class 3 adenylate cyclase